MLKSTTLISVYKKRALVYTGTMFADAHIHILDTAKKIENSFWNNVLEKEDKIYNRIFLTDIIFCASADAQVVFEKQEKFCSDNSSDFALSFGIHPQNPMETDVLYLEKLLKEKRINAIGECGFDLFNSDYKNTIEQQKRVWNIQIEFALKYSITIVIHCRKALHLLFDEVKRLKKLPAVIFHSWSGSASEATSFLRKGVNAYFSIGKGLLRGQKSQIETAKKIDISHLLTETDAPYMALKGEFFSMPADIKKVAEELVMLRGVSDKDSEDARYLFLKLKSNFKKAYALYIDKIL